MSAKRKLIEYTWLLSNVGFVIMVYINLLGAAKNVARSSFPQALNNGRDCTFNPGMSFTNVCGPILNNVGAFSSRNATLSYAEAAYPILKNSLGFAYFTAIPFIVTTSLGLIMAEPLVRFMRRCTERNRYIRDTIRFGDLSKSAKFALFRMVRTPLYLMAFTMSFMILNPKASVTSNMNILGCLIGCLLTHNSKFQATNYLPQDMTLSAREYVPSFPSNNIGVQMVQALVLPACLAMIAAAVEYYLLRADVKDAVGGQIPAAPVSRGLFGGLTDLFYALGHPSAASGDAENGTAMTTADPTNESRPLLAGPKRLKYEDHSVPARPDGSVNPGDGDERHGSSSSLSAS